MIYKHKFDPPWEHEGKTYEEMEFNFDGLTGRDLLNIEEEMKGAGSSTIIPEFDKAYQYRVAARAAKIGSDVVEMMPARDFTRITNRSRSFLMQWDSLTPKTKGDGADAPQEAAETEGEALVDG